MIERKTLKKTAILMCKKSLSDGKTIKAKLFGTSMIPTIYPGSTIFIKKQNSYEINDIVAFDVKEDGYFVVHRIVKKCDNKFLIVGDNSKDNAEWVNKSDVYGVVLKYENKSE